MSNEKRQLFFSASEAASFVKTGDTVALGGLINILCPEQILKAIEERFLSTKQPRELTLVTPVRVGNSGTGLEHFAHEGMLKRLISGSYNSWTQPTLCKMIADNIVEGYAFPMGVLFTLFGEIAAGNPGLITKVGLNTFVDPRLDGGKVNQAAKEDLVDVINLSGEEYLHYKSFPINVAIIRGTTADERGNISLEHEPVTLGVFEMALVAHNSGGSVIAQVKRVTSQGSLHPRKVVVPGALVDVVVVDEFQKQILNKKLYNPSLVGEVNIPFTLENHKLPLDRKKIIMRRAALELQKNQVVNLGDGIPVLLPYIALEEGFFDKITFSTEHGAIGGLPTRDSFGAHSNPQAIICSPSIFRFYQSGGLDCAFVGFAQIDETGNVNVSHFAGNLRGPGGFIDITHSTKKIVFCGSLTAGGLKVEARDGKLKIVNEGKHRKFLRRVEQITFRGENAISKGQEILYITERGVFKLTEQGIELLEIAPGIDLQEHILKLIDFEIQLRKPLKQMNKEIFQPEPMKLNL